VDNDKVIDSRASQDGASIRRRRECLGCQHRYSTYERTDDPIKCPFCHEPGNRVLEPIESEGGFAIQRKRECLTCRREFTTVERSEERALRVVKKDSVREPFDRQKIKRGLERACWKRPVSDRQLEDLVTAIETELRSQNDSEVPVATIGELVMKFLADLDQVAYVRFASVYRRFEGVQDFVKELRPMLAEEKKR
jgi:transcriptional repressor NrdR